MNNEEKILSILEALTEKVGALDEKFGTLDEKVSALDEKFGALDEKFGALDEKVSALDEKVSAIDEKVDKLESRQTKLEFEVRKTNAVLENEIRPNISLLAEGHKGIIERLDRIEITVGEFEEVKNTVSALRLAEIKRNKTSNF